MQESAKFEEEFKNMRSWFSISRIHRLQSFHGVISRKAAKKVNQGLQRTREARTAP